MPSPVTPATLVSPLTISFREWPHRQLHASLQRRSSSWLSIPIARSARSWSAQGAHLEPRAGFPDAWQRVARVEAERESSSHSREEAYGYQTECNDFLATGTRPDRNSPPLSAAPLAGAVHAADVVLAGSRTTKIDGLDRHSEPRRQTIPRANCACGWNRPGPNAVGPARPRVTGSSAGLGAVGGQVPGGRPSVLTQAGHLKSWNSQMVGPPFASRRFSRTRWAVTGSNLASSLSSGSSPR